MSKYDIVSTRKVGESIMVIISTKVSKDDEFPFEKEKFDRKTFESTELVEEIITHNGKKGLFLRKP